MDWILIGIAALVLSLIIANAGAKREIGFGWALFLGIWFSPIISLIAVLLSDRLPCDELGYMEKKWGCMAPLFTTVVIICIIIIAVKAILSR